jgi:hypothetical protein
MVVVGVNKLKEVLKCLKPLNNVAIGSARSESKGKRRSASV